VEAREDKGGRGVFWEARGKGVLSVTDVNLRENWKSEKSSGKAQGGEKRDKGGTKAAKRDYQRALSLSMSPMTHKAGKTNSKKIKGTKMLWGFKIAQEMGSDILTYRWSNLEGGREGKEQKRERPEFGNTNHSKNERLLRAKKGIGKSPKNLRKWRGGLQ